MTYDYNGFGARLKQLRKSKVMLQNELGEALGVTGVTIGVWERGCNYPGFWNLVELAEYFDVGFEWLIRGDINERTSSVVPVVHDES